MSKLRSTAVVTAHINGVEQCQHRIMLPILERFKPTKGFMDESEFHEGLYAVQLPESGYVVVMTGLEPNKLIKYFIHHEYQQEKK